MLFITNNIQISQIGVNGIHLYLVFSIDLALWNLTIFMCKACS